MDRRKFLKAGIVGPSSFIALPAALVGCSKDNAVAEITGATPDGDCNLSPSETAGPFPIKTPAELVRANIISDRIGVALLITITVVDQSADCAPMEGVYVDLWHCDKDGDYSEYGGSGMQKVDYTGVHFLRGRQMTDAKGEASFISIYPGWYRGRAPHIHLEILDPNESSIRVTQIAFPEDVSNAVYASEGYNGVADTSNTGDNVFSDSLERNMADSITGNVTDGYVLLKTVVV